MRQPTDWLTPDVRPVQKGLAKAQNQSFRFRNYMMATDLLKLIRAAKLNNEFGLSAFMSFLLVLRVPSETLMMRLAAESDCLTQSTPQEHKVLVGIRIFKGEPLLLAKFAWRKNLPRGCILRRPRLCNEKSDTTRVLCPIRMLWPRMADI